MEGHLPATILNLQRVSDRTLGSPLSSQCGTYHPASTASTFCCPPSSSSSLGPSGHFPPQVSVSGLPASDFNTRVVSSSSPHISLVPDASSNLPMTPNGWVRSKPEIRVPSYFPAHLSSALELGRNEPSSPRAVLAASDIAYWKENAIHKGEMNKALIQMGEEREARLASLEMQRNDLNEYCGQLQREVRFQQLKSSQAMAAPTHIGMEIHSLRQQLDAVSEIRDTLFQENIELQTKLDEHSKKTCDEARVRSCVVCCDNLADVVMLPCKHLCVCRDCSTLEYQTCPICRGPLEDLMRIYAP